MTVNPGGTVALVGSGEYLPPIEALDCFLLDKLTKPPKVVVLPTASAPDGPGVPEKWANMGLDHFKKLGVPVEAVMLLTREDAESELLAEQIAQANFIYFSGGKPRYLLDTLKGTKCWNAVESVYKAGGVVAGCSAGAMVLTGHLISWPQLWQTEKGLGLGPDVAVIPHFDEIPGWMSGVSSLVARGIPVVGIDGYTGLVVSGQEWEVNGLKTVTVFKDKTKRIYHSGEKILLQ